MLSLSTFQSKSPITAPSQKRPLLRNSTENGSFFMFGINALGHSLSPKETRLCKAA